MFSKLVRLFTKPDPASVTSSQSEAKFSPSVADPPSDIQKLHESSFKTAVQMSQASASSQKYHEMKGDTDTGHFLYSGSGYMFYGRDSQLKSNTIVWPGLPASNNLLNTIITKCMIFTIINNAENNRDDPCDICDVGGGEGHFLISLKKIPSPVPRMKSPIRVLNLTAWGGDDATHIADGLNRETELAVGDMHQFSKLPEVRERRFKLIFSFNTLEKSPDPFCVIAHLFEKLDIGGALYIDMFVLPPELLQYWDDIIKILQDQGHPVTSYVNSPNPHGIIRGFTLFKTDNKLVFPVSYSKTDSPAGIYTPTLALIAAQKQRIEKEAKSKPTKLSDAESAKDYLKFWHKNIKNMDRKNSQEESKSASSSAKTDASSKPPSASV